MEKDLNLGEETKEMEILEFHAGGNIYGVDIRDIREILPYDKKARKIHNSNPYIEGIIKPRDFIIPIIDVVSYLKLKDVEDLSSEMLIVSNIKNMNIGFHVDTVEKIHTVSTASIAKLGKKLSTTVRGAVKGVVSVDSGNLEILDFRYIISDINPNITF